MYALMLGVLSFLIVACSTPSPAPFPEDKARPFQTAGHEQFFLPELPHWANGSVSARCQRAFSVRFFDYTALEKIHGLTFPQRVELQTQFNLKWRERFAGKTALVLTPQEEATLFLETLGQVKSGLKELRFPEGKINLVWWDSLTGKRNLKKWLTKISEQGHPVVLVSLCEGSDTIERWLENEELDGQGFFAFGAETLGPMRPDGTMVAGLVAPLEAFIDQKRATLWVGGFIYPVEFPAGYTVKTVED